MSVGTSPKTDSTTGTGDPFGILIEFDDVTPFLAATRRVRDAGYHRWDTYSPFPVHGIERAMGMQRTILPFIILGGGVFGCVVATLMQWWMNAISYPLNISGKPLWSIPANVPVIFELTVLFGSFGAFFGMMALNRLPEYSFPLFQSERFKRVTTDRFFIAIESTDRRFHSEKTWAFAESLGGIHTEWVEGDGS